jgi:hypothetical protein
MRKIELAGTRARLAPGEEMRAVGGELVHARIAVPVVTNISPDGVNAMSVGKLNGPPPCVTFFHALDPDSLGSTPCPTGSLSCRSCGAALRSG